MASQQQPAPAPALAFPPPSTGTPVLLPADSSVWDRISTWVSEHKAVVYTIAGVTVAVAAGGVVYYSTSSVRILRQLLSRPATARVEVLDRTRAPRARRATCRGSMLTIYIFQCPETQRCNAQAVQEGEEEAQGGREEGGGRAQCHK